MSNPVEYFIKRSMHVSTRAGLPDKLVPGYLYFVEDEGVILLRMDDEVHTYAKRGPQGPMGPQGPAGPGYYPPPSDPLPNPPAPPSGEFPVGTMLQFNSLPYKVPDGGTWEVDVTCMLSTFNSSSPFPVKIHNVKYKALLPGGETLTLQKLITGAEEKHEAGPKRYELLYKAGLLAAVDKVSINFVLTTWQKKYVGDKTHYVPLEGNCPGKATRKS